MSLYPPPQDLETEVFARLPAAFRDPERASGWIDANKPGAKMDSFLEGPTFDPEGNLYVTDIPHGRIFKVTRERVRQIEAKAVRKLQHPIRSRLLEGFLERPESVV